MRVGTYIKYQATKWGIVVFLVLGLLVWVWIEGPFMVIYRVQKVIFWIVTAIPRLIMWLMSR